jgi:hypothetical protein
MKWSRIRDNCLIESTGWRLDGFDLVTFVATCPSVRHSGMSVTAQAGASMVKSQRRRVRRRSNVEKPKVESSPRPAAPASNSDLEQQQSAASGHSFTMKRGGKWIVGTAASAAITTAVAFGITKAGENAAEPAVPIAINIVDDPALIDTFAETLQQMIVPAHPSTVQSVPQDNMCGGGLRNWALRLGGSDWKLTRFRLQLQGHSSKPVLISDMTAHVIGTREAPPSIVLECQPAGHMALRELSLDLDAVRPAVRYEVKGRKKPFGFTLNNNDEEVFDITAYTNRNVIVDWYLQIQLVVDGKQQIIDVQDHAKSFRTTAAAVSDRHRYAWSNGQWSDQKAFRLVTNPFG